MTAAGAVFITPHSVRQFISRVAWAHGWTYEQALAELIRQTAAPRRVSGQGSVRTLHCHGFRAIVAIDRRARRGQLPVLLTVLVGEDEERD